MRMRAILAFLCLLRGRAHFVLSPAAPPALLADAHFTGNQEYKYHNPYMVHNNTTYSIMNTNYDLMSFGDISMGVEPSNWNMTLDKGPRPAIDTDFGWSDWSHSPGIFEVSDPGGEVSFFSIISDPSSWDPFVIFLVSVYLYVRGCVVNYMNSRIALIRKIRKLPKKRELKPPLAQRTYKNQGRTASSGTVNDRCSRRQELQVLICTVLHSLNR